MLKEFRDFIAKGNVMDLAVGIIIGAAFTAIVNSLVNDLINPVIGTVIGGLDFSGLYVVLRGTVADGAKLEIIDVPGAGQCLSCGKTVEISAVFDPCPECGGYPVNPTAGTEMRVRELEVD